MPVPSRDLTGGQRPTRLILDAVIFSLQRHGGISVYFHELLRRVSRDGVATSLVLNRPMAQTIPQVAESVRTVEQGSRLLERYRTCRIPPGGSVFHSSYYRLPSERTLPTVVTVHDFIYERFVTGPRRWVHARQKRMAIRSAQAIICVSESTRQDLLELVGATANQQLHVIHNGVAETFRPLHLPLASRPFVLFVGQRPGYKNFRLVLDAMTLLPDLELRCVGGGDLRIDELHDVPEDVRKRVRHVGFVTDADLNVLYNQAVCLAYPSSYEGFGIPVIEAMRAGCPVVCTECKAVLEVGRNALVIVTERDAEAMAQAVLRTTSATERASIVQAGFAVAHSYSWEQTYQQTLDVYRTLMAD